MKQIFFSLTLLLAFSTTKAQEPVHSAKEILSEAYALAAKENKKVFVMFHASWCGWCHKMDKSMNDESCKQYFDDNFVIRHLVVNESPDKKNLENPGAEELKTLYHGEGQGIPFWLIFDKDGKLLADSKIRKNGEGPEAGENSGCPASENEVDFFISILKKTTSLNKEELESIEKRFRKNEM
ncbi:MAG: thioredoxin family protein [Chitinophagaceae bacterium]